MGFTVDGLRTRRRAGQMSGTRKVWDLPAPVFTGVQGELSSPNGGCYSAWTAQEGRVLLTLFTMPFMKNMATSRSSRGCEPSVRIAFSVSGSSFFIVLKRQAPRLSVRGALSLE